MLYCYTCHPSVLLLLVLSEFAMFCFVVFVLIAIFLHQCILFRAFSLSTPEILWESKLGCKSQALNINFPIMLFTWTSLSFTFEITWTTLKTKNNRIICLHLLESPSSPLAGSGCCGFAFVGQSAYKNSSIIKLSEAKNHRGLITT